MQEGYAGTLPVPAAPPRVKWKGQGNKTAQQWPVTTSAYTEPKARGKAFNAFGAPTWQQKRPADGGAANGGAKKWPGAVFRCERSQAEAEAKGLDKRGAGSPALLRTWKGFGKALERFFKGLWWCALQADDIYPRPASIVHAAGGLPG